MKLNHLNLVVTDVARAVKFFEKQLGFKCLQNRNYAMAILTNTDEFVLVLWSSKLNKSELTNYPENFHIGFYQQDKESVIKIYEKLQGEDIIFESEPKNIRNTFGFYFHFDNVMIEISVLPS